MQREEIFLQKNYEKIDENLAKYGCFFLTLCFITQFRNKRPAKVLGSLEDILAFKAHAQKKGWLDEECFVQNATALLSDLAPAKWVQAKGKDFGFMGTEEFLPLAYPVDLPRAQGVQGGLVEIACFRERENRANTHFVLVETNSGRDFTARELFNTLGSYWTSDQSGRFFPSDKRVFYWVE